MAKQNLPVDDILKLPFWDVEQLSLITGLTVGTLYVMKYNGDLPPETYVRFGRLLRFKPAEVLNWMQSPQRKPVEKKPVTQEA